MENINGLDLVYEYGCIYNNQTDELVFDETETKSLIETYYTDFDSLTPHPKDYINKAFFGSYEEAYNNI